jgi:hypothetical protein
MIFLVNKSFFPSPIFRQFWTIVVTWNQIPFITPRQYFQFTP